jgi:hypothetical protein
MINGDIIVTHDELLAKIDDIENKTNHTPLPLGVQTALLTQNKALRAVVKLAATYKDGNYVNEEFNQGLQTTFQLIIEAIEKELK